MITLSVWHFDHCAHKSFILLVNKDVSVPGMRLAWPYFSVYIATYGRRRYMSTGGKE
jgi:hypothetical protein